MKPLAFVLVVLLAASAGGLSGGIVAYFVDTEGEPGAAPVGTPEAGRPDGEAFPDIPTIIEGIRQSVVAIEVTVNVVFGPQIITQEGAATGFVFSSDGMIATNAHVVSDALSIRVTLPDGSVLTAELVGIDTDADLALIHIDRTDLVPMTLGESATLRVGDIVLVVGNALALEGGPTVGMGIASALDRTITTTDGSMLSHLIQTDAAVNEGDSGGPLTNTRGELVGISTAGTTAAENIGFAIAIDNALPILEQLSSRRP